MRVLAGRFHGRECPRGRQGVRDGRPRPIAYHGRECARTPKLARSGKSTNVALSSKQKTSDSAGTNIEKKHHERTWWSGAVTWSQVIVKPDAMIFVTLAMSCIECDSPWRHGRLFVRGELRSGFSRRTRRDKVPTSTVSTPSNF